jgi:phage shock protein PspC (stress-responsive transcriptional regulator)
MNKTVTINISGIIFHIEEDAFEKLSKYLNTIKGYFSNTEGGNEIMADIEARIAEMLQTKVNNVKQVVLMADVDAVIEVMGRPEEFAEGNSDNYSAPVDENTAYTTEPVKKRLFRDPDNKAIGGVCSGIAAYFDVDIVWVRLAMVLLVFFAGVSLWVYIILWIVIPEAKTTADKLAMRGEKVDINNISKTVKEEAEQIKKRMEKYGTSIRNNPDTRNFFDKLGDFFKDFIILFTKFFGRLIGLVLLIFGVLFMLGLMSTVFGFSVVGNNTEFNDWINLLFVERSHYTLGLIGISLAFGIPVLMMIYGGVKLLFRIHYSNRWLNLSAGLIWLVGFVITLFVGVTTGKDFSDPGKIKEQVQLQQFDTLYLSLNPANMIKKDLKFDESFDEDDSPITIKRSKRKHSKSKRDNDYVIVKEGNNKIIVGYTTLNIVPSLTENFELYVIKKARGEDKRAALDRAKVIEYKVFQDGNKITFDEVFTVNGEEKFRVQDVQLILKVPRNKVIHLDQKLESFIDDVENVTNTFDADMVGRRWIMGPKGLQCVDCEGLESDNEADLILPPVPPIPPGKTQAPSNDADVKIDKNGIVIKSKDGNVNITDKGIHIDTKGKK